MTYYVIASRTTGIDLTAPRDHYFIGKDVTVSVADDHAFFGDAAFYSNAFRVRGTVEAFGLNNAFLIEGGHTRVAISSTGEVTSESTAIELSGSHSSVVNRGAIVAGSFGVRLDDVVGFIKNTGTITSDDTGIYITARGGEIENYGVITADKAMHQVAGAGEITSTYNNGIVTGISYSFAGSLADDTVLNTGELTGDVFLYGGKDIFRNDGGSVEGNVFGGSGQDVLDLTNGTVSGTVYGGYGNDTYIVDSANLSPHELMRGGHDRVVSSVSYSLGVNIEMLRLSGTGSIDGTGNDGANKIFGNDAANVLSAGAGADKLYGLGGNDTLICGTGNDRLSGGGDSDTFVFASLDGHDKIRDFEPGLDSIDLSNVSTIADFQDMMDHHVKASGANVIIHADGDRLTLLHTTKADLHAADFTF